MEKYDNLGLVGEGSYGMVLKCKHKETGQFVAIKKFLESEDDKMVKKIAMREIRMLKQLRHENLVNLIEVFRRKKRLYLVFEFVDHTVLDDLEKCPNGLDENTVRRVLWQVLRGIEFCHLHNIIHRDVKPENILVSKTGVVKLCDFGFARTLAQPGEPYTEYVATRWYRAPELLVGDTKYGRAVDIWAVGCLTAEMLTGDPLFPGDSDIDQLFHIVKCFGNLTPRHREIFYKNPLFVGMRLPEVREREPLEKRFPRMSSLALDLMKQSLQLDASERPTCSQLLRSELFTKDNFAQKFPQELRSRIQKENQQNPLLLKSMNRGAAAERNNRDSHGDNVKENKEMSRKKKKDKDNEDKPKRKLPDPDHFIKKHTPPVPVTSRDPANTDADTNRSVSQPATTTVTVVSNAVTCRPAVMGTSVNAPLTSTIAGNMQKHQQAGDVASHETVSHSNNPDVSASGMPPIQSNSGGHTPVNTKPEKVKKTTTVSNKKTTATHHTTTTAAVPSHHTTSLVVQSTLQSEKTSLHDKSQTHGKTTNSKRRGRDERGREERGREERGRDERGRDERVRDERGRDERGRDERGRDERVSVDKKEGSVSLPEVRGAEGHQMKTNKSKKSFVSTMPHIANIDPFSNESQFNSSPSPEKEGNFPLV